MREAAEPARDGEGPQTIEEAQDQIAEAQARLGGGAIEEKPTDTPAPTPAPAEGSDGKKKDAQSPPRGGATATPTNRCESSCRAYASMRRAVESLCRMTGETDERCIRARRTLETSTSRVATCMCR